MTTTTPDTVAISPPAARRPSTRVRFAVAFLIGLLVALGVGAGAIYAYDQQYLGRVLPGVRVGTVDLSGLDATTAAERLRTAYADLGKGQITITGPAGGRTILYSDIGRGPDVEAMLAEAMAVGRDGNAIDRAVADARTALRGVVLAPRLTYDPDALAERVVAYADSLARDPVEAAVKVVDQKSFVVSPGADGRVADPSVPVQTLLASVGELDAPSRLMVEMPVTVLPPSVTTAEATQAKADAERIARPIELRVGDTIEKITSSRLRTWLTLAPTADGGYGVSIDTTELPATLKALAKRIDRAPVNASFKTSGGRITGVTASQTGQKLDLGATLAQVQGVIDARLAGATTASLEPTLKVTQPVLTTAEAKAAQPKMRRISRWTTYFPISEKNGFGANIWIPAKLIDGYVVAPGATFDFWDAIGPVTRAKGYKTGGAIINGRTEPQGALAGGICSCSTTLFNAALRAGYDMGARRNHFYYIDRYPLGLDATVFISASGSKQTMSFTNDTEYPILIRGYQIRDGSAGYVRFELFSVPNGRRTTFSKPIVRNVRYASDTVQYTSSLRPGVRQRVEYPVDGKQVTVTRTVRDRHGKVIHTDTYFSNYARITGITLVGR
ncbi:MAG TPA: VanW family protein [Candidatus Limnocylindrales bacterium]|jgi:vancomycin resistance protein YoaR|nr:VanW family protein [Candidatus Limnocylindrales bacterium]